MDFIESDLEVSPRPGPLRHHHVCPDYVPTKVGGAPRPRVSSSQTRSPTDTLQEYPWPVFQGSANPPRMTTALTEMGKGQYARAQWDNPNLSRSGRPPEEAARDLVNYGQELTPQQLQQTKELVDQHTDVLSIQPGRTTVLQHHIEMAPGVKVHVRP
ncbi:hypothetical protein AAFF_G00398920 [Aldrovandia affinis]|uniref:Uncharacterized protein n=1 Tax=Aldrovandia affinis TaxID=143900 RepID=A0AAD7WKI1_9TELE|nr:hypothetical protein AAFF_G00398920 [Aldrovandia affinis]